MKSTNQGKPKPLILDSLEYILLAFFVAVNGWFLANSMENDGSRNIILVASGLLLIVLLVQFARKLRVLNWPTTQISVF